MPIIEKFLGGTAAGFHPDELKERRKKPSSPRPWKKEMVFRGDYF